MSTFSQWPLDILIPGILKNFAAYKQETKILPDTKSTVRRQSARIQKDSGSQGSGSQSGWES